MKIHVRCKTPGCGTLLGTLSEHALRAGQDDTVTVKPCPRCSVKRWEAPPRRRFEKWAKGRRRAGESVPMATVALKLQVADVLAEASRARRRQDGSVTVTA